MVDGLETRPATIADADRLAPMLRATDVAECTAVGVTPLQALRAAVINAAFGSGFVDTVFLKGEPVAIFGSHPCPYEAGVGVVWMVGTPIIELFPLTITKFTRRWLPKCMAGYTAVRNFVDERNTTTIDWLESLGFAVGEERFDAIGTRLRPFRMEC